MTHLTDSVAAYLGTALAALAGSLRRLRELLAAIPRYFGLVFWRGAGLLTRAISRSRRELAAVSRACYARLPASVRGALRKGRNGISLCYSRLPGPLRRAVGAVGWGLTVLLAPRTEHERERRRVAAMVLPFFCLAVAGAFVPLAYLLRMSFSADNLFIEGWSTAAWSTVLTGSQYHTVAFNTVVFAAATSVVAVAIGVAIAHALTKYDPPFKSAIVAVLSFPIALPGIVVAFMIIVLFGRQGLLTNLVADLTGGNPIQMAIATATVSGLFLGYLYSLIPRATMVLRGTYAEINTDAEEAARALGATPWQTFYHVTLPEIRPGVIAALILTFRTALAIFGTVLILQGLSVATLQIDTELSIGFNSQVAAAIGVVYFLFILAVTFLGLRYVETDVVEI